MAVVNSPDSDRSLVMFTANSSGRRVVELPLKLIHKGVLADGDVKLDGLASRRFYMLSTGARGRARLLLNRQMGRSR